MSGNEYKEAQKFYKNLRLKGSKYQFENSLGVRIKCFGVAAPNGHAELHEQDIIVGLLGMVGTAPSFEDLVVTAGIEAFDKVDVVYDFSEPFEEAWEESVGVTISKHKQTRSKKYFDPTQHHTRPPTQHYLWRL